MKGTKRKPYTRLACENCKAKHQKCDGQRPCFNCSKKKITCEYRRDNRDILESVFQRMPVDIPPSIPSHITRDIQTEGHDRTFYTLQEPDLKKRRLTSPDFLDVPNEIDNLRNEIQYWRYKFQSLLQFTEILLGRPIDDYEYLGSDFIDTPSITPSQWPTSSTTNPSTPPQQRSITSPQHTQSQQPTLTTYNTTINAPTWITPTLNFPDSGPPILPPINSQFDTSDKPLPSLVSLDYAPVRSKRLRSDESILTPAPLTPSPSVQINFSNYPLRSQSENNPPRDEKNN